MLFSAFYGLLSVTNEDTVSLAYLVFYQKCCHLKLVSCSAPAVGAFFFATRDIRYLYCLVLLRYINLYTFYKVKVSFLINIITLLKNNNNQNYKYLPGILSKYTEIFLTADWYFIWYSIYKGCPRNTSKE